MLSRWLRAVIARVEKIDLGSVTVNVDRTGDTEVLELNIVLPDGQTLVKAKAGQPAIA